MTNLETKNFENDDHRIDATFESGCQIAVNVFLKPIQVNKCYKRAIKNINKEISIPGFRKGKAPESTVISRYASYVESEWKELIKQESLRVTLESLKIYPFNKESVRQPNIQDCTLEEGAHITIRYEHYPRVPEINFSELKLPLVEKVSIAQENVDEILNEVQRTYAEWEEVEGRSVQEGDFVDLSIDAIDQEPVKSIVKDRRFEVLDKRMARWLKNLLIGMSAGEKKEALSELEEDADEKTKASFKPTKCLVTLHAIKKILLPPIDDELAKKAGSSSKEELYEKIRANLEKDAEIKQREKKIEALENALLETYYFDVPFSLYENERRARLKEKIKALKESHLSDEQILSSEQELEKTVASEVDEALRLYFLTKKIGEMGKVEISNKELNEEIVRYVSFLSAMGKGEIDTTSSSQVVSKIASRLFEKKVKEYALSQIESSN